MVKAVLYLVAALGAATSATVVDTDFDGEPARVVERAEGQYVEAVLAIDWAGWELVESVEFDVAWSPAILSEPTVRAVQEGSEAAIAVRTYPDVHRATVTVTKAAKAGALAAVKWKCVGPTKRTVDGKPVYGAVSLPLTRLVIHQASGDTVVEAASVANKDTLLVPLAAPKAFVRLNGVE